MVVGEAQQVEVELYVMVHCQLQGQHLEEGVVVVVYYMELVWIFVRGV